MNDYKIPAMRHSIFYIILCLILLIGCSLTTLYSITYNLENPLWKKQAIWAFIGICGFFSASLVNYKILKRYALFIYIISIILLIVVLFMPPIRSTHSWFVFPGFSFQPSELAKLSTIIMLSFYLKDKMGRLTSLSSFFFPFIIILIPVFLILLQPDLGSSFIFFPVFFFILYLLEPNRIFYTIVFFFLLFFSFIILFSFLIFKGYNLKLLLTLIFAISILFLTISFFIKKNTLPFVVFLCLIPLIALFTTKILKDYQRKRLLVFLDQSFDPTGAGYNIVQSKIAVGGGGIFGLGFLKGPQSHLGFLPEKASDFIFAAYAEEWGFIGVVFLISLLFFLIVIGFSIASSSGDIFASLLASAITSMIGISSFMNIGICLGILPVAGTPLPFISYGGSSLLCNMTSLGILVSIRRWGR